jgi:Mg-chelatase subunit ChlD
MTTIVIENNTVTVTPETPQIIVEPEPKAPHQVIIGKSELLDRNAERLVRMTQVFTKFAGTLTLRPIKVEVSRDASNGAPAWSDSDSITFSHSHVGDLTQPRVVTALKGLSLHEISHIMMTPRYGSILAKNVQRAKVWPAFNALEDQRIEMAMVTKFSSVSDWFVATIAEHLLKMPNQLSVSFPLIYGRKYLPTEIRKVVRDSYEQQQNVVELSSLIDRYIVLNLSDTKNYAEAFQIITRYHELVSNLEGTNPNYPDWGKGWARVSDPNKHCDRKNGEWKASKSKPLSKSQQEGITKRIVISNGEGYDDPPNNIDPASATGQEAGNGGDFTQMLEDTVQQVMANKNREIVQAIKQFSNDAELTGAEMKPLARNEWVGEKTPTLAAIQSSKSFANELEQLKALHDPAWLRQQSQGRLNVQRYALGCEVDEAFDQWESGREDAVDIEAVILLDISGSMSWTLENAYGSMWAIKRALDKVNASTTVLTFGNKSSLLYSANERATTKLKYAGSEGSTEPLKALRYARSVLANSKRAIKIVISITDGVWWGGAECDEILKYLRKAGVLTALAYVTNPDYQKPGETTSIDTHGCAVAVNVTNGKDLFTLARQMVKVGVARNLAS